jgi:hypothetical protein
LEIPSLSHGPLWARLTAFDGLGYRRLGSAGFRLWAEAGTSLISRVSLFRRLVTVFVFVGVGVGIRLIAFVVFARVSGLVVGFIFRLRVIIFVVRF